MAWYDLTEQCLGCEYTPEEFEKEYSHCCFSHCIKLHNQFLGIKQSEQIEKITEKMIGKEQNE